jgi:hypothetical protein
MKIFIEAQLLPPGPDVYRFDVLPQVYTFTGNTPALTGSFTRSGDTIERTPAAGGGADGGDDETTAFAEEAGAAGGQTLTGAFTRRGDTIDWTPAAGGGADGGDDETTAFTEEAGRRAVGGRAAGGQTLTGAFTRRGDTIDWTPAAGGGADGGDDETTAFAEEAGVRDTRSGNDVGIITQMQKRYPGKRITIELEPFEYADFLRRFILLVKDPSTMDDGHDEVYTHFVRHSQPILAAKVAAKEQEIYTDVAAQEQEIYAERIAATTPTALVQFGTDEQLCTAISRLQMEKPP